MADEAKRENQQKDGKSEELLVNQRTIDLLVAILSTVIK